MEEQTGEQTGGSDFPHLTPRSCGSPEPNVAASVFSPVSLDPRTDSLTGKLPHVLVMIFLFASAGCSFRSGCVGVLPPKPDQTRRTSLGKVGGSLSTENTTVNGRSHLPGWAATSEGEKWGGEKKRQKQAPHPPLEWRCFLRNKPGIKLYFQGRTRCVRQLPGPTERAPLGVQNPPPLPGEVPGRDPSGSSRQRFRTWGENWSLRG